jgi:hypothetical protein
MDVTATPLMSQHVLTGSDHVGHTYDECGNDQGAARMCDGFSRVPTSTPVAAPLNHLHVEPAGTVGNPNPKESASKQPRVPPRKRPNTQVRNEFTFKETADDDGKKTESHCKHCHQKVQTAEIVNITKLAGHLISACKACPAQVREQASLSSQKSKKKKKLVESHADDRPKQISLKASKVMTACSTSPHGTSEALTLAPGPLALIVKATQTHQLSRAEAMRIMRFDVEFALANFMNFGFFDDPWWKAAASSKEPGIFLVTLHCP